MSFPFHFHLTISPSNHIFDSYFLQVDFELTGNKGSTPGGLDKREWKHKHCKFLFWQSKNAGNKSWHTGVWKRKLIQLSNGPKSAEANLTIRTRAKFILDMRENAGDSRPVKGMPFYKFEEDLPHHIREALVIISTGSALSFFENPFVRDWLNSLEPRHRPIYRKKLARLIRCIIDITTKEVSNYNVKTTAKLQMSIDS